MMTADKRIKKGRAARVALWRLVGLFLRPHIWLVITVILILMTIMVRPIARALLWVWPGLRL